MLRLGASAAGALLWSALYLLLTPEEFLSLFAAVLFHELGHILLLLLLDGGVDAICLTGTGLRIDCRRALSPPGALLAALAGPAFGALWALCAHALGFERLAGLSAALTAFNLLPLSFLDGGRALSAGVQILFGTRVAERAAWAADGLLCIMACAFGLLCAGWGLGAGTALAGAWLTLFTVKKREHRRLCVYGHCLL